MKICVHDFMLSDVDDPDIYAAEPLYKWQQSEQGQWVMKHSVHQPYYNIAVDHNCYGYKCKIYADLSEIDLTYFKLKWA